MKTYTTSQVLDSLVDPSMDIDNEGQLIIYTGFYRWKDGTIRDEPEPEYTSIDVAIEEASKP